MFTGYFSVSKNDNDELGTEGHNTEADVQLSWRFELPNERQRPMGTLFIRWATQRSRLQELFLDFDERLTAWQLSTGLNVSLF